jgi:outer membrane protein OmpA-like peptidoglycan-associated protein
MGDIDRDGVLDGDDFCPATPQGAHPDRRRLGCPDEDTDSDGVFNTEDVCPTIPIGLVPDPLRLGCPAPDRDGDTLPDATDACPDIVGGPSRDPARNGCPGLVSVDAREIHLLAPVYFAFRRESVLPQSVPVLEAIRDALVLTPRIRRVRIEGHTDLHGIPAYNNDLSRHRAAYVERWLVEHGVEASRLESYGFGASRPIEASRSPEASERNRRVELHIIDPVPPTSDGTPVVRSGGLPAVRTRHRSTTRNPE